MERDRLKRFFLELRNLGPLSGLDLFVHKELDYLLIGDQHMIHCMVSESDGGLKLSFNRYLRYEDRSALFKALRKIATGETILLGEDTFFVGIHVDEQLPQDP